MSIFERFVRSRIALACIVARCLFPKSSAIVGVSCERFTLLKTRASAKDMFNLHRAFCESAAKLADCDANNSEIEG